MDLLNHSASTCLEDYCDILECDHDRSLTVSKTNVFPAHVVEVYEWSLNVALPGPAKRLRCRADEAAATQMRGIDPKMCAHRERHVSSEAQLDCSSKTLWTVSHTPCNDIAGFAGLLMSCCCTAF